MALTRRRAGRSGLADRTFWAPQLAGLAGSYRVVALDLGGHGESGHNRGAWRMPAWAEDVRAVADALALKHVVLIGNSLGGAVALEAARKDPVGVCRSMVESLFHKGTQTELRAWAEKRMCATSPEVFAGMLEGFGGYDLEAAFRNAGVPIRAINGDPWPSLTEGNRKVTPDFDAVVMANAGHYPQLERPEEFNRKLLMILSVFIGGEAGEPAAW